MASAHCCQSKHTGKVVNGDFWAAKLEMPVLVLTLFLDGKQEDSVFDNIPRSIRGPEASSGPVQVRVSYCLVQVLTGCASPFFTRVSQLPSITAGHS